MTFKILVTHVWIHPHLGGENREIYEYETAEINKAIEKYQELYDTSGYSSTSINIVKRMN